MIINHNISSINANRLAGIQSTSLSKTMSKLSSGMRINQAGDDASGLAVSEKMRAQISGLNMAAKNATDGISFIQTTEGYLDETQSVIRRIRELAVQSANGVYTDEDRMQIQVEVSQLVAEVDRIASHAQFNGLNMLTGRFSRANAEAAPTASMWFQIGANSGQRIQAHIGTMTLAGLGIADVSISTINKSDQAIAQLDEALQKVGSQRADLGAYQNRMELIIDGVNIASQNMQAAESQIRDANMAEEMVNFAKEQILSQASVSMLAHANAKNQAVLRLLG